MRRLLVLALTLCAATAARAEVVDKVTRTVPAPAGGTVRIELTVGDVTITGSSGTEITIDLVRRAPTAEDLTRIPFIVDEQNGVVRVAATQAEGGRDAALRTDLVISMPSTFPIEAVKVFEGHVKLANLRAACDVDLTRGAIEATGLAGKVRLESEMGSIDVRQPDLAAGGMLRLRVFNGTIRTRMARPPVNARILAVVFNGTLKSDIPLTMKDKFGPRFGETTLGTGAAVVSMDVVKGDIALSLGR